jgi:hypothetical protein
MQEIFILFFSLLLEPLFFTTVGNSASLNIFHSHPFPLRKSSTFAKHVTAPACLHMDAQNTHVTHYAILIGIDDYPDKPLKSCVRDVQDTKAYLESVLHDSVAVHMVTASRTDPKLTDAVKDRGLWPTRDNIISAFNEVTSLARAGDFVYIHYSGHGTRKPPSGEFSNKSTGDLALVLLGEGKDNQVRYLWGFELGYLLKAMVDNGLIITLILDCCFSASVYRRDDPNIRFLPYNADIDSEHPLDAERILDDEIPLYRDVSMRPNWLMIPDRYVILAACSPYEEAVEPKFDGQNHGALSYLLLEIIKRVGLTKRHKDIHDHLRAKFEGFGLPQNPVLYGNRNQGFFGQVNSEITAINIPVIVKRDGLLELKAGHAHGISAGDLFVLYPLGCNEDLRSQRHSAVVRVSGTRGLTSDLEPLDILSIRIQTGWIARALTRFSLRRFPIRLASSLPYQDELRIALKEHSLEVHDRTDKSQFVFDLILNDDGECEILDESGHEMINLINMLQDHTSVTRIGTTLEHLARFRLVTDLVNEAAADSFRHSFDVQLLSNGETFDSDRLIQMEHNAIAELVVENRGDTDLYVFVYDLGPCWQVENANHGTYIVVRPQHNEQRDKCTRKKLRMMIPDLLRDKGHRSCKDILKIFVTSQPTSFDLLELPRLGGRAKASEAYRTSQEGGNGLENWFAMNFSIYISLQDSISK